MLNKRQLWRRQLKLQDYKNRYMSVMEMHERSSRVMLPGWEETLPSFSNHPEDDSKQKFYCETALERKTEEKEEENTPRIRASVSFSQEILVILIPTADEYIAANLSEKIWWNREEYKEFRHSAFDEVYQYMVDNKISDISTALRQLYYNSEVQAPVSSPMPPLGIETVDSVELVTTPRYNEVVCVSPSNSTLSQVLTPTVPHLSSPNKFERTKNKSINFSAPSKLPKPLSILYDAEWTRNFATPSIMVGNKQ